MKINPLSAIAVVAIALTLNACTSTNPTPPTPVKASNAAPTPKSAPAARVKTSESASTTKPYSLATCIVSDEPLESMGGSITKVYGQQEVKFCCKGCVKEFEESPEEFLKKLN